MTGALLSTPAICLVVTTLCALPAPLLAAGGAATGSGSGCTVTVITTNEDGSTDNSVKPFQAACRSGQSNGEIEYYNPYTDTYQTRSDPRVEPLRPPRQNSSTSKRTGTSQSGSGSTSGSTSSQSSAGSSGAPCTSSGTSSKAIKKTRSTASGRPCLSPLK
jgi:hypothetical protein